MSTKPVCCLCFEPIEGFDIVQCVGGPSHADCQGKILTTIYNQDPTYPFDVPEMGVIIRYDMRHSRVFEGKYETMIDAALK